MANIKLSTQETNLLFSLPRPAIFAHRGASLYAPENTLAAFELAIRQGADAIELDAKLTADEKVIVFHDLTLNRTTNFEGDVSSKKLAELKELDAGSYFDIAFRGELIPTLEEVLESVGGKIFINVELSNFNTPFNSLPEKITELIKRHNLSQYVMFSSFNPVALLKVKRLLPQVPIGILALRGWRGRWARSWMASLIDYQALHPHYSEVDELLIDRLHRKSRRIQPHTVNKVAEMQRLMALDIDGIFTDDPLLAYRTFRNNT